MSMTHPPIWPCDPNYIVCRFGHLHKHKGEGHATDQSGLTGYIYHACTQCSPKTYAFGIISVLPTIRGVCTFAQFYAITREQFVERPTATADEMEPAAMLHHFGYHPNYKRAA